MHPMNIEQTKKSILYKAKYRGTKEADLIISNFIKKNINEFSDQEMVKLNKLLALDDEIILSLIKTNEQNLIQIITAF